MTFKYWQKGLSFFIRTDINLLFYNSHRFWEINSVMVIKHKQTICNAKNKYKLGGTLYDFMYVQDKS